jgi:hypothetical protein
VAAGFLHSGFNDLWLIPCALPPVLWLQSRLGLRPRDATPACAEIFLHLAFWSMLFEWIGPRYVARATGDPADVAAYAAGAILAALWWHRKQWQAAFHRP